MRRLARGAAAKQIASISGHKSLHEIERYTAAADQKQLSKAAMGTRKGGASVQSRGGKCLERTRLLKTRRYFPINFNRSLKSRG